MSLTKRQWVGGVFLEADLPHPKVAQREEHIPVSVMPGMWFPRSGLEEVPS